MASLFLDFPCQSAQERRRKGKDQEKVLLIEWSPLDILCAIATDNCQVNFYVDEANLLPACVISRKANATCMKWQSSSRILATGWQDGHIGVYDVSEKRLECVYTNDAAHGSGGRGLRFLMWNPACSRLVTGDGEGVVRVWKSDNRGLLNTYKQYGTGPASAGHSTRSPCTAAVFSSSNLDRAGSFLGNNFSPSFFFSSEEGNVFFADDLGHSAQVQSLSSCVDELLFYDDKRRLIILTRSLLLVQLQVDDDGRVIPVQKVKLSVAGGSGDRGIRQVIWAGPGLIAAASGEAVIRFWNLSNDDNYTLSLQKPISRTDRVLSLGFNHQQRFLAVGTKEGKVAMYRYVGNDSLDEKEVSEGSDEWEVMTPTAVAWKAPVTVLTWGPGRGLFGCGGAMGSSVMREDVLHRVMSGNVAALQLTSQLVRIDRREGSSTLSQSSNDSGLGSRAFIVRAAMNVRGVAVSDSHLAVWNGTQAQIFELGDMAAEQVCVQATAAKAMAFYGDYIFRACGSEVQQCNLKGRVVRKIPFSEGEGAPTHLDINGSFLVVATAIGLLKVFDLSKRDRSGGDDEDGNGAGGGGGPRQVGSSGKFVDKYTNRSLGAIRSIAVNCNGRMVSILSDEEVGLMKMRKPNSKLFVYVADNDMVESYDCATAYECYPTSHFWDREEPKLLAIETRKVRGSFPLRELIAPAPEDVEEGKVAEGKEADQMEEATSSPIVSKTAEIKSGEEKESNGEEAAKSTGADVATLFVTAEHGIQLQGTFPLEAPFQALIGLHVPNLIFAAKTPGPQGGPFSAGPFLKAKVLHDFIGLENVDGPTRKALLDFAYFLTVKDLDSAHRAVKLIKNPSVWENMAFMCVKTRRLDVAEVCLGNMGFARGAAAVRLSKNEPEAEARIATVAVQLGLISDAEKLYKECGRYDLLNRLHQASGAWDKALDVAENNDRIHLKTTHYSLASHLEAQGNIDEAMRHFYLSGTHRTEIPRILFANKRVNELEEYISRGPAAGDEELTIWWAGYLESIGSMDRAKKYYNEAKDYYSLVRIACFEKDLREAKQIVDESASPAAAYYFARYLEGQSEIQEAIGYYALAKCYNHAIRLAKNFGLDSDLMPYALKCNSPPLMIDVASYFEKKGELEKAVQLYQRAGDIPKALDICFKAGAEAPVPIPGSRSVPVSPMFEVLRSIAGSLDENANPQTVARCAEFFIEHNQFEKAVQLFITGKRYAAAIDLCVQHKVKITDEMAEGLTPPKEEGEGDKASEDRNEVLRSLARACKKQGSFQLACKKYTQGGEREKAMKCLLKSGDTKAICYYANVSRNRNIYILAANYLQALDWQNEAEVMKNIVLFYTKAKAFEQLSSFFDAYAQMEIDEYRDYEKALSALKKASEYMMKARSPQKEELLAALNQRIYHMEQFVSARSKAKTDPQEMVKTCHQLLEQREVETAIRVGDCFALLVEFYHTHKNYEAAFKLLQDMRQRQIVLNPYLEADIIDEIHLHVGAGPAPERQAERMASGGGGGRHDDDDEDEMEEEFEEEEVADMDSDNEYGAK